MTRYLISFDDGSMTFPEEELPEVAEASHAVVREAQDAAVWVFGGGLERQQASVVATDGTVANGPYPETKAVLGGSRSSMCPHVRTRWSGLPRLLPRAAVRKRSGRSCPTRPSDRRRPAAAGARFGSGL